MNEHDKQWETMCASVLRSFSIYFGLFVNILLWCQCSSCKNKHRESWRSKTCRSKFILKKYADKRFLLVLFFAVTSYMTKFRSECRQEGQCTMHTATRLYIEFILIREYARELDHITKLLSRWNNFGVRNSKLIRQLWTNRIVAMYENSALCNDCCSTENIERDSKSKILITIFVLFVPCSVSFILRLYYYMPLTRCNAIRDKLKQWEFKLNLFVADFPNGLICSFSFGFRNAWLNCFPF